jgi:hypothetical protein
MHGQQNIKYARVTTTACTDVTTLRLS